MLHSSDLINLPFPTTLTQAGVAAAGRWLAFNQPRKTWPPYHELRTQVLENSVSLALRRHLASEAFPPSIYSEENVLDGSSPRRLLGNRRLTLVNSLLSKRELITRLRQEPRMLLGFSARVDTQVMDSEDASDDDLLIFSFAYALLAAQRADLETAIKAGQPAHLMHAFSPTWNTAPAGKTLRPLALKLEKGPPIQVEIGGLVNGNQFHCETLEVRSGERIQVDAPYQMISYLSAPTLLEGRLGLSSPSWQKIYVVQPFDWHNIWVYGMRIVLTGFLTMGEFRSMAQPAEDNHFVSQAQTHLNQPSTRKQWEVPVADLFPISDLVSDLRKWTEREK